MASASFFLLRATLGLLCKQRRMPLTRSPLASEVYLIASGYLPASRRLANSPHSPEASEWYQAIVSLKRKAYQKQRKRLKRHCDHCEKTIVSIVVKKNSAEGALFKFAEN